MTTWWSRSPALSPFFQLILRLSTVQSPKGRPPVWRWLWTLLVTWRPEEADDGGLGGMMGWGVNEGVGALRGTEKGAGVQKKEWEQRCTVHHLHCMCVLMFTCIHVLCVFCVYSVCTLCEYWYFLVDSMCVCVCVSVCLCIVGVVCVCINVYVVRVSMFLSFYLCVSYKDIWIACKCLCVYMYMYMYVCSCMLHCACRPLLNCVMYNLCWCILILYVYGNYMINIQTLYVFTACVLLCLCE